MHPVCRHELQLDGIGSMCIDTNITTSHNGDSRFQRTAETCLLFSDPFWFRINSFLPAIVL